MKHRFKFLFILIPVAFATIAGIVVMLLWNGLMPGLFGFGTLSFFQALGLLILARILFGTFGGKRFGPWGRRRHRFAHANNRYGFGSASHPKEAWRKKMQDRWESLSPEQKAKFTKRCGHFLQNMDKEETTTSKDV